MTTEAIQKVKHDLSRQHHQPPTVTLKYHDDYHDENGSYLPYWQNMLMTSKSVAVQVVYL